MKFNAEQREEFLLTYYVANQMKEPYRTEYIDKYKQKLKDKEKEKRNKCARERYQKKQAI